MTTTVKYNGHVACVRVRDNCIMGPQPQVRPCREQMSDIEDSLNDMDRRELYSLGKKLGVDVVWRGEDGVKPDTAFEMRQKILQNMEGDNER